MTLHNDFNHLQSPIMIVKWLSCIVLAHTNPIFIHILPPKCPNDWSHICLILFSLSSLSHRPPASGGEISTHSVNFPNGSCDLRNWEMSPGCHQMSRDVTRTWILLASMAWRCSDCDMLQRSSGWKLWTQKSPTCSGRILKVCWSSSCSYTFSIFQWHCTYIYIYIYPRGPRFPQGVGWGGVGQ